MFKGIRVTRHTCYPIFQSSMIWIAGDAGASVFDPSNE
jgi:hypothetical protein